MPRQPRSVLPPAGVYHVTSRGVARQSIYRDDDDRSLFVALLRLARDRWCWRLLAYCLMPNHFHAVVETKLPHLSRGMHLVNFRYAQAFNERHDRVGHLFQGRFGTRVIEDDDYLESTCTYVLDNAVRAGLCTGRGDWPWLGGELVAALG